MIKLQIIKYNLFVDFFRNRTCCLRPAESVRFYTYLFKVFKDVSLTAL